MSISTYVVGHKSNLKALVRSLKNSKSCLQVSINILIMCKLTLEIGRYLLYETE